MKAKKNEKRSLCEDFTVSHRGSISHLITQSDEQLVDGVERGLAGHEDLLALLLSKTEMTHLIIQGAYLSNASKYAAKLTSR